MLYLGQHPTRVFPLYIWNARCRRAGTFTSPSTCHRPIDYRFHDITAEDERGIILALKQRDRVHRVRFQLPVSSLQKVIVPVDEEYLILEYLVIGPPIWDHLTISRNTSSTTSG